MLKDPQIPIGHVFLLEPKVLLWRKEWGLKGAFAIFVSDAHRLILCSHGLPDLLLHVRSMMGTAVMGSPSCDLYVLFAC